MDIKLDKYNPKAREEELHELIKELKPEPVQPKVLPVARKGSIAGRFGEALVRGVKIIAQPLKEEVGSHIKAIAASASAGRAARVKFAGKLAYKKEQIRYEGELAKVRAKLKGSSNTGMGFGLGKPDFFGGTDKKKPKGFFE